MLWTFWISVAFVAYSMVGYAGCLWVLSLVRRKIVRRAPMEPMISILIVVRGGANVIEEKLCNCLEQNYSRKKMEIVVVCDGPAPETEAIVEKYSAQGVRLMRCDRQGKSACLAHALGATSGEIVVFTDAGVTMDSDSLCRMAENFSDPRVGCVSSEDATRPNGGNAEPMYISFDSWLRRREGEVCTLIGASGALFAARRSVCSRWPERLSSDFHLPLRAIEDGLITVVDTRVAAHLSAVRMEDEFERKVRTIVHGIDVLVEFAHLLNPFRYGLVAWELASHKLFRWLLPLAFLTALISNIYLYQVGNFYRVTLLLQIGLLATGGVGIAAPRLARLLPFKVASFLLIGNMATIQAWLLYLSGERYVMWEPSKRREPASESVKEGCERYADR
jgi:glycosyltransferase involved in cell wall biosynthesis